jgi:hypothetical protein
LGSGGE